MKALVKLALIVGAVAVAAKLVTAKQASWQGLTEAEVREKVQARLPSRVPDDKRDALADRVVAKMRARGAFGEEAMAAPPPAEEAPEVEQPDAGEAETENVPEEPAQGA